MKTQETKSSAQDEILKHIETVAEDFSNLCQGVEDTLDKMFEKIKSAGLPDHKRAPNVAHNLILNYPDMPEQVREFLECIRDNRHYEQNISNLALVI